MLEQVICSIKRSCSIGVFLKATIVDGYMKTTKDLMPTCTI